MSTLETPSVHDSDGLSRLPSYRSRWTARSSNQNTQAPSYCTHIDSENHVVSSATADDTVGNPPSAQFDDVQRVEGREPLVSSAEPSPLHLERLEPLRYSVVVQPNDQASPNVQHFRTRNVLSRGPQRVMTVPSEGTQPPPASSRNRSATLPSALGGAQRNLSPVQFPLVHIIRYSLMEPLVTGSLLKHHLSLLSIFRALKKDVENMDELRHQSGLSCLVDGESRWTWFVGFAVERFSAWSEALKEEDSNGTLEEMIPPVDVLMVWHTYLLNPGWYAEDCYRIPALNILGHIGRLVFAPKSLHAVVKILRKPITQLRRDKWDFKTQGRPFDAFEDAKRNQLKLFSCPDCQQPILHPYMDDEGTGYLQQNFRATCSNDPCYFNTHKIVKTSLGARKFADDLVRTDDNTHRSHIAGTFWAAGGLDDGTRARKLKTEILDFGGLQRPSGLADERLLPILLNRHRDAPLCMFHEGWVMSILYRHAFSLPHIIHDLALGLRAFGYDSEAMSRRIYSAYTSGDLFSVDLRGSVLRQCSFVEQMDKIGWLTPGFFKRKENEVLLHHAVIRYHGFIDLISSNVAPLLVPTLDIDLAWHTHQISGPEYHSSCMTCIGRFVDHNDKIEENRLTDAFEETSKAWRAKFEVDYTSCGCPLTKAVNDHLYEYLGLKGFRTKSPTVPEGNLHRQLSPSKAPSIIASTHRSDHDAVYNNRQPAKSSKLRAARLERRNKKLKKGGKSLRFKRDNHPDQTLEDHDCPFAHPILVWYSGSDKASYAGYAAHMVDSQPLGEITDVPQEIKKYSDSIYVTLHILE